ncbi:MAG TPA: 2-oxopent-4-enoate hydratase [Myxococcales bacterium]|nr:2-oxopent-4-enoate hydratase [Myxococcales bacterium]
MWRAEHFRTPCEPVTSLEPDLSTEDAYAIQAINLARHGKGDAGRLVGHKVGLTSEAIQSWLGVDQPDFGGLLSSMEIPTGAELRVSTLMQPRAEGEIAFVLAHDLRGPQVTVADVLAATDFVLPAIEVIDSRIRDWKITFADTVADNASSGRFILGTQPISAEQIDLRLAGMWLRKNGRVVSTGAGAACMDNPVHAVAWLANTLADLGTPLLAGQVILSGALGPAVPIVAGDFLELNIGQLGGCAVRVV